MVKTCLFKQGLKYSHRVSQAPRRAAASSPRTSMRALGPHGNLEATCAAGHLRTLQGFFGMGASPQVTELPRGSPMVSRVVRCRSMVAASTRTHRFARGAERGGRYWDIRLIVLFRVCSAGGKHIPLTLTVHEYASPSVSLMQQ